MPAPRPFGPHCCLQPSMASGNRHPCRDYPPLSPGHPWPATARGRPYHYAGRSLRPSLRRQSLTLATSSLIQALSLLAALVRASGGSASMAYAHCTLDCAPPSMATLASEPGSMAQTSPRRPRQTRAQAANRFRGRIKRGLTATLFAPATERAIAR